MAVCQVGAKYIFSFKEVFVMISFEPFFDTLDCYEVSTYTLIKEHHISSSTIHRLRHNQPVSTATVEKLCKILNVTVWDIMEFKSDK